MKIIPISTLAVLSMASTQAASLIVNWAMSPTDSTRMLRDFDRLPLSAGSNSPGDGALLELGFYTSGTTSDPFAGNWRVLLTSSIGDDGVETDGRFSTSSSLVEGALMGLRPATPLSIRFYDGTSVANSSRYNAVSKNDGSWNYLAPADPAPVLNLIVEKGATTRFEGGLSSDFRTYKLIPEPGTAFLAAIGGILMLVRRARR